MTDSFTDRTSLAEDAYADSSNLRARRAIYEYRTPPLDFIGWALGQMPIREGDRVVDVGCGPGQYVRRLPTAAHPVAFDISAGMLAETARSRPGATVAVADAQAIPLVGESVDVALAMHMLYHVPDVDRAISELRRVLKPEGVLVASTNGKDHMGELDTLMLRAAGVPGDLAARVKPSDRFDLDGGEGMLRKHFVSVERHDTKGELVIDDAEPIVAYVESVRSLATPFLPPDLSFDAIVGGARRLATEAIDTDGDFRITVHAGLFLCRGTV